MKTSKQLMMTTRSGAARTTVVVLLMPLAFPPVGAQIPSAPLTAQDRQRTDGGMLSESQRKADDKPALPKPAAKTIIRANAPKVDRSMAGVRMSVQGFRFEGNVGSVSPEAIEQVLSPWKGRDLSFAQYEEVLHAVAKFLRENGHPNAEVRVSRAQIRDNMISVAIQGLTPGTVTAAPLTAEAAGKPLDEGIARVFVREFRVSGSDVLPQAAINVRLAPFTGRALTLKEMDEASTAIASAYREKGYGLAQAFMPPQKIEDGLVDITIQAGIVDGASGNQGLTVTSVGKIVEPFLLSNCPAKFLLNR